MLRILLAFAVETIADKHSINLRAFKCPHARLWLEHGAEKASEILGIKPHKVESGATVERCSLAEGFPGGAHQDARSPGYDSNCSGTPGELSPYQWPLAFSFEWEETTLDYDSDDAVAFSGGKTWYLLNKNWKRADYLTGHKPGRPASGVASLDNMTVIHRNEQIIYIKWKDDTDHKNVSTIETCTAHRVGGIGNIRPDWFMDSRPYLTNDIASQYLGNQHVYHRGEPTLVKQWRKSDFANQYFVMSMKEHVGEDGIHWPLMINIPGETNGPDNLRSMYNHEVIDDTQLDMFLIDQAYIAAGGSCPANTPPPSPDSWMCGVCAKVYDPETDGEGVAFEDLPDDWVCPRCGSPKAAYHQDAGSTEWVLEAPALVSPRGDVPSRLTKDPCKGVDAPCTESFWRDIEYTFSPVWEPPAPAPPPSDYKCNICKHIYDPDQDGEGVAFLDLADDWVCPICGAPKTAYEPLTQDAVLDVFTVV